MIQIASNDRIFVCGKSGSGKTVFVKMVLWRLFDCKVYFDIKHEELTADAILLHDPNTYMVSSTEEFLTALNSGKKSIVYVPVSMDEEAEKEDFDRLCEICYKWGNICLVVDEANYMSNQWGTVRFHREIMLRGRSRNVGIINCSQRPKEIPSILISESNRQYTFKLNLDDDLKKMKGIIPKSYHNAMYSLKPHYFIYSDDENRAFVHLPIPFEG